VLHPEIQFLTNARPFFNAGVAELVTQFGDDLATMLAGVGRKHGKTPAFCSDNYILPKITPEL